MFNLFTRGPTHCSHSSSCLHHLCADSVLNCSEEGIRAHFPSKEEVEMFLKTVVSLTAGMFYSSRLLFGRRAQCVIRPGECCASPCQSLTFLPARHTLLAVVRSLCLTHHRGCSHHLSPCRTHAKAVSVFKTRKATDLESLACALIGHDLGKQPGISRMHFLKCCSW